MPPGLGATGLQVVSFFSFTFPDTTWRPAAPRPTGQIQNLFNIRILHPKMKFLPNNLSSNSLTKQCYTPCLRKSVKTPPPPYYYKVQTYCFLLANGKGLKLRNYKIEYIFNSLMYIHNLRMHWGLSTLFCLIIGYCNSQYTPSFDNSLINEP